MPAAGNLGGAGFRAGALPIVLLATDTGFAYQPMGETSVTGVGGLTLPVSSLTQTSRPTTPFNSGAGLQQTITGLNALGALVIGLGTNPQATVDPRQGLESISKLTGATNQSVATIANGTADPIAPGDPFYFQIASGFGASVANGIVSAIQNAVTNVAMDITVQASDPRVHIINHSGVAHGVGAGATATFDVEFQGDGIPHRFDLQFVRQGTNVVLGSIPVVIGTPIPGDGYEFEDLNEGEIHSSVDFGNSAVAVATVVAREIFYNQSAFDGNSAAINAGDDSAIATDKTAYLPYGNTLATFANVSSYTRGINGIMVDIAGPHGDITANDFVFKHGNNNAPGTWATVAATPTISVRAGAGVSGSDRVTITWASGSIRNEWLEVQVLPTASTGLATTDVFFWGNKVGDTGQGTPAATFLTSGTDKTSVLGLLAGGVGVTSIRDFNRDNNVTAVDATVVLSSLGSIVRLQLNGGPFAPVASGGAVAMSLSDGSGSAVAAPTLAVAPTLASPNVLQFASAHQKAGSFANPFTNEVETDSPRAKSLLLTEEEVAESLGPDDSLLDLLIAGLPSR